MGQSRVRDVDDAFQLLLLIVGLVFSIFTSGATPIIPACAVILFLSIQIE